MLTLIIKRLLSLIPTLFVVTVIVTLLVQLVPGDPAVTLAGESATPERLEEIRGRLGTSDSILEQYVDWMGGVVRGDLGESVFSGADVSSLVAQRFPASLSLTMGGLFFALVLGTPVGVFAATHRGSWADRAVTAFSTLGVALPNYFLAMLLILPLALWTSVFPATGYVPFTEDPVEWAHHLVLPSVALGSLGAATVARQLRGSLIDVLSQDYIRAARAKGLRWPGIVLKHGLKNGSLPVVAVLGVQVARMLGGTVVIESIFGIPGLGSLVVNAAVTGDVRVIQGVVIVTAAVVVAVNLLTDVLIGYLNPRTVAT